MNGAWRVTCSKCGKVFLAQQQYLQHVRPGYPCGPQGR